MAWSPMQLKRSTCSKSLLRASADTCRTVIGRSNLTSFGEPLVKVAPCRPWPKHRSDSLGRPSVRPWVRPGPSPIRYSGRRRASALGAWLRPCTCVPLTALTSPPSRCTLSSSSRVAAAVVPRDCTAASPACAAPSPSHASQASSAPPSVCASPASLAWHVSVCAASMHALWSGWPLRVLGFSSGSLAGVALVPASRRLLCGARTRRWGPCCYSGRYSAVHRRGRFCHFAGAVHESLAESPRNAAEHPLVWVYSVLPCFCCDVVVSACLALGAPCECVSHSFVCEGVPPCIVVVRVDFRSQRVSSMDYGSFRPLSCLVIVDKVSQ